MKFFAIKFWPSGVPDKVRWSEKSFSFLNGFSLLNFPLEITGGISENFESLFFVVPRFLDPYRLGSVMKDFVRFAFLFLLEFVKF